MKNLKSRNDFVSTEINEMAKGWPIGSIVKFNTRFDAPPSNRYVSKYNDRNWYSWTPSQPKDATGGSMYIEITESGKMWLSGKILYVNCTGEVETGTVRMHTSYAEKPTSEFKIFQDNADEIKNWMGKSFFLEGDEEVLTVKGDTMKPKEGEYIIKSMNFKLTDIYEEPVFFVSPKGSRDINNGFSVKLSSIDKLQGSLDKDQMEVIKDWFSKQFSTEITLEDGKFNMITYTINASDNKEEAFKNTFSAGPFVTYEEAEKFLDDIKKLKIVHFDASTLKINRSNFWSTPKFTLEEMIMFCKNSGIEVSVKKLMELKKGAVTGRRYGI